MNDELMETRPADMEPAEGSAPKTRKWKKWKNPLKGKKKRWLVLALVVVAAGGIAAVKLVGGQKAEATTVYQEAAVETRSITNSLSSSGTLEPADSYVINTLVSGEILSDTFEKGDEVEEGQLLYTLDSSNAQNSQTQAQNSYSQAQSSYSQAVKAKYPSADMSGTVSEIYVNEGDTVSAGTELLKIVGDDNIYMTLSLLMWTAAPSMWVRAPRSSSTALPAPPWVPLPLSPAAPRLPVTAKMLTTVRVKVENPGLVTSGYTASAVIGSYSSYGESSVKVSASSVITAEATGKITGFNWLVGDSISSGDRICTLTGDSVDNAIENARISMSNASTSLSNAQDTLDDYNITAPISGTVVTKNAKAGDTSKAVLTARFAPFTI